MSPRTIPLAEGQSLISLVIGLFSGLSDHVEDCKDLIADYLQMNPEVVNYVVEGLPGEQPLAFILAKSAICRKLLYQICRQAINEETLNYTLDGKSVLSYLSRNAQWRNVLYTEKNVSLIIPGCFNLVSHSVPAAVIILRLQPDILLTDHVSAIFSPQLLQKYFQAEIFCDLLSSNHGITVMLKYRELRDGLNQILRNKTNEASALSARLEAVQCMVLKNLLTKEAKELPEAGYDKRNNLFHAASEASSYISYQNTDLRLK